MTTEQITSLKKTARITGGLMLIMAVLAGFGILYIPETLLAPGDPAATLANVQASENLLRTGIAVNALIVLIEIALVALLYKLLAPVNKNLSLMAAFSRLAMTVVQGVNIFNLLFALLLATGSSFGAAFEAMQLSGLVFLFLEVYGVVSLIWGFMFGLHLVLSGYLIYKARYFPKFIGILLIAISVSYFLQSFGTFLLPQFTEIFATIGLLSIVELVFPVWLLVKGVKDPA